MTTNVSFDTASSRRVADPTDGSILGSILEASQSAGLDAVAELYNEALVLAKDGHFGQARERLQVLLGLAPSDGDAHLLLAKVHVAGQQWRRALSELDEAHQCGASVPDPLRDAVLRHLQADTDAEEDRTARSHREQGELAKLRSEARRLRSEHAHMTTQLREREREAIRWAWVATGTSLVGIVAVVALAVVGAMAPSAEVDVDDVDDVEVAGALPAEGADDAAPDADADDVDVDAVVAPPAAGGTPDAARVRDPGLSAVVAQALQDAGVDGSLTPMVRGSNASLSGSVAIHADLKKALAAVQALDEIDKVDADAVTVRVNREGTRYTVRSGDSLSRIAYQHYGNESFYTKIQDANPALGGGTNLQLGQELVIPAVE